MKRPQLKLVAVTVMLMALAPSAARAASTTVGDVKTPAALFDQVMAAYKNNAQHTGTPNVVRVRPGTYVIPAKPGQNLSATWSFSGENALHDCTIDLTGRDAGVPGH